MDPRGALAKLFLAGRSPEEQAQRILQQKLDSGMMGGAGAGAPQPLDMTQPGPWGAGQDPAQTGAVPKPRPSQFSLPQEAPIPTPSPGMFPPDLAVSPPHPADPMAASAPTDAGAGLFRPPMPPSIMGVPPDLRGTNQFALPPSPDLAVSPPRGPDPMAASAPTEIGAYEAKKATRKAKTKKAQSQFRLKAGKG